jgi:hypothetical protein
MRRALAWLVLAAACAGGSSGSSGTTTLAPTPGPTFAYHVVGLPGAVGPLWVKPLGEGSVEYQFGRADRAGGLVTVERTLVNKGEDPVRLDLGRVRLRADSGDEAGLLQACSGGECLEAGAAHGQVTTLEPGKTLRLRTTFGPVSAEDPLEKVIFVDEGIFVAGRLSLVAVELQRGP